MIVIFGSIMAGQTGVSCGMLAAALSCAEYERKRVFLISTDFRTFGWEDFLLNERRRDELRGMGTEAVLRAMRAGALDQEMLDACTVTLPGGRISFLPGNLQKEELLQAEEETSLLERLIELAVLEYDMVFIDAGCDFKICDRVVRKNAKKDIAEVICLNQNRKVLDFWFEESGKRRERRMRYYLIGMYRTDSNYTIKNLRKRYPDLAEKTGVLPWCTEYQDACSIGEAYRFFARNTRTQKDDPNYSFVEACKDLAVMLVTGKGMS